MTIPRRALILGCLLGLAARPAGAVPTQVGALTFTPPGGMGAGQVPAGAAWDWWGQTADDALRLGVRVDLPTQSIKELLVLGLAPGYMGRVPGFKVDSVRKIAVGGATEAELAAVTAKDATDRLERGAVVGISGGGRGYVLVLMGRDLSPATITSFAASLQVRR